MVVEFITLGVKLLTELVALISAYHHTQIYLHELALHDDHAFDDFLPPYRLEKVVSILPDIEASSSFIKPVSIIISSSHELLDTLLELDLKNMRSLPIFNFARMAHAFVVLTKIHISSKSPASLVGSVVDTESIKLGSYLESLIDKLGQAVGPMECRAPFTFLGLLMRLQIWHKSQEKDVHFQAPHDLHKVLDHCWLPAPPSMSAAQSPMDTLGVDRVSQSLEMTGSTVPIDPNGIGINGIAELATMQPLPNFNFEWGQPDINQFLEFGSVDMNSYYGDCMPGVETQPVTEGTQVPGTVDWATTKYNDDELSSFASYIGR
jgi:hypothetical protein